METKYVITWTRPEKLHFYIRWINPDGSFFGEAEDHLRMRIYNVEGRIPTDEWTKCRELISRIQSGAEPTTEGPSEGVLGSWTRALGEADIIFRYQPGAELRSAPAKLFLELTAIVERQATEGRPEITQSGPRGLTQ